MSPTILCRLCRCYQNNFIKLFEENGQSNEIYEITVKYFDPPMLLASEQGNHLTAICLECWHHINEFYEFQQLIYKAHEKLESIEIVHLDEKIEHEENNENNNGDTPEDTNDDVSTLEHDVLSTKAELEIYDESSNEDSFKKSNKEFDVVADKDELVVYYEVPLAKCGNDKKTSNTDAEKAKSQDKINSPNHGADSDDNKSDRKLECTKCYKVYKFAHGLREHMAKHTEQIIYQCQHCPTKFTMYRNISRHMKTRHPKEYAESCSNKSKNIKTRLRTKKQLNLEEHDLYNLDYKTKDENSQDAYLLTGQEHFVNINEFSQSSELTFGQETNSDTEPLEKNSQAMEILEDPIDDSTTMDEFAQITQLSDGTDSDELPCSDDSDDDIQSVDEDIDKETIDEQQHNVGESKFKCPHCRAKFTWEGSLSSHIKRVHPEALQGYDPNQKTSEENPAFAKTHNKEYKYLEKMQERDALIAKWLPELECIICKNTFTSFPFLNQHFKDNHPNERLNVICCGNKYPSRSNLYEHIQLHLDPNAFKCELCKRCFKDSVTLKKHKRRLHTEHAERPFECEVCEKKFKTNRELKTHSDLHNAERNHVCKMCDKAFPSKQRLKKHEHNAHQKNLCEHCGQSFHNISNYRIHLFKHTGVEPPKYPCNICGAQLKSRVTLYLHKKAIHHDHSTIYVCSECGKVAATKKALKVHKRNVHGPELKRKFKCSQCDKAFRAPQLLREHEAGHAGEPLYACPHCPTKIKAYPNFQRHLKNFHPKEYEVSKFKAKDRRSAPKIDLNLVVQEIVI